MSSCKNQLISILCPSVLISHYIVVLPFIIYLIANIYAADVNQLAALSEDVDNEEPQKSKRGKKSKTYFLALFCMSRIALFCSF